MTLLERRLLDLAAAVFVDLVLRLACRVTVPPDFDLLAVRVAARKGTCSSSFWPLASFSLRKLFQFLICAVVTL